MKKSDSPSNSGNAEDVAGDVGKGIPNLKELRKRLPIFDDMKPVQDFFLARELLDLQASRAVLMHLLPLALLPELLDVNGFSTVFFQMCGRQAIDEVNEMIGRAFLIQGEPSRAVIFLEKVNAPHSDNYHEFLGRALFGAGRYEKAALSFHEAAEMRGRALRLHLKGLPADIVGLEGQPDLFGPKSSKTK